jgi:alpha-beta hydrolase superfamily lysophospholipase
MVYECCLGALARSQQDDEEIGGSFLCAWLQKNTARNIIMPVRHLDMSSQTRKSQRSPAPKLTEYYITAAGGGRLSALYGTPSNRRALNNADELKTVLLVHGFAAEKTENGLFSETASQLLSAGYRVLAYDWRGLGKSEGDFSNLSLDDHVSDFKVVVEWLRKKANVSNVQICAVGFSLGAVLVAKAVQSGVKLGAVVFWSPATRPAKHMWPRYNTPEASKQLDLEGFVVKPDSNVRLGRAILDSLRDTDLGERAFDLGVPLLVCHGSNDTRIPISASRHCFDAVKKKNKDKVLFAEFIGASHSFRPKKEHRKALIKLLSSWLRDRSVRQGRSRKQRFPQAASEAPSRASRRENQQGRTHVVPAH